MNLEWTIMTTKGPAVGEMEVPDREAACEVLDTALRGAFGSDWGPEHASACRAVCRALRASTDLPFAYRARSVAVTLDA